jgi:two-component system OmpR family sensor kinase
MPIRWRLTLVVALTSALLVAAGGVAFYEILERSLVGSVDRGLVARATLVTRALSARLPDLVEHVGHEPRGLERFARRPAGRVVQLVDPAGQLLDVGLVGESLLSESEIAEARRQPRMFDVRSPSLGGGPVRAYARPVPGHPGWVVVVAGPLAPTLDVLDHVRTGLLVAGGPVVLLAAAGAFVLAGAALRPVERMRRQAAAISEHDTAARLEVPPTRDEIARLGSTMDALLARLQATLERQRRLVADAGHELRTPLAILRAELELASRPGRSRGELEEAVRHAGEETERVSRLAEGLLVLATAEEGRLEVRTEEVPVAALAERAVAAVRGRAAERRVAVLVECPGELVAELDPVRLRQALDNLLDNALRVAPPGSTVRVALRAAERGLVLEVADDGPGFPVEFLEHAFERFSRPDEARGRATGGAGLGLAIVKAVAEAHGGRAEAENAEGGGARVRLVLPRAMPRTAGTGSA